MKHFVDFLYEIILENPVLNNKNIFKLYKLNFIIMSKIVLYFK